MLFGTVIGTCLIIGFAKIVLLVNERFEREHAARKNVETSIENRPDWGGHDEGDFNR